MLRAVNKDQAHFIALLAKVARMQRDKLLGNVAEDDLGGTKSSRGEHNPTAPLGFEPLLPDDEQLTALREAISSLAHAGRARRALCPDAHRSRRSRSAGLESRTRRSRAARRAGRRRSYGRSGPARSPRKGLVRDGGSVTAGEHGTSHQFNKRKTPVTPSSKESNMSLAVFIQCGLKSPCRRGIAGMISRLPWTDELPRWEHFPHDADVGVRGLRKPGGGVRAGGVGVDRGGHEREGRDEAGGRGELRSARSRTHVRRVAELRHL